MYLAAIQNLNRCSKFSMCFGQSLHTFLICPKFPPVPSPTYEFPCRYYPMQVLEMYVLISTLCLGGIYQFPHFTGVVSLSIPVLDTCCWGPVLSFGKFLIKGCSCPLYLSSVDCFHFFYNFPIPYWSFVFNFPYSY